MIATLYSVQALTTGKLSILTRPRGGDWLRDETQAIRDAGVDIVVSCLTPEEVRVLELEHEAEYCKQQGITYHAFPIIDRSVPPFSNTTFSFLEQLHRYLSSGKHVGLHCWQGLGRSVLMAANLLVLNGFPPEQACELLSRARGCSVPETEEQRAWIVSFSQRIHTTPSASASE